MTRPFAPVVRTLVVVLTTIACAHRPTGPAAPVPSGPASAVAPPSAEAEVALAALRGRGLLVPVAGVDAARVPDTFGAPRGGRRHNALDILAPRGTPVLAADDGRVFRLRRNAAGGLVIYAVDRDERFVYYYAHLERYRDGLAEGMQLARGDTIGFVGTSGNAPPDVPHLHFQLMLMPSHRNYWDGHPIDPRPLLTNPSSAPPR